MDRVVPVQNSRRVVVAGVALRVLGGRADALVWYTAWDDGPAADRFADGLRRGWEGRWPGGPADRRSEIARLTVAGRPAVRLVDAPVGWAGWKSLPQVGLR